MPARLPKHVPGGQNDPSNVCKQSGRQSGKKVKKENVLSKNKYEHKVAEDDKSLGNLIMYIYIICTMC